MIACLPSRDTLDPVVSASHSFDKRGNGVEPLGRILECGDWARTKAAALWASRGALVGWYPYRIRGWLLKTSLRHWQRLRLWCEFEEGSVAVRAALF
jgi:hypothetical protein